MNPPSRHLRAAAAALGYVAFVAWVLFATIVIVLRYAVLPNIGHYRADLEGIASRATGETVRIGSIDASWRGLRPALALADLTVVDAAGTTTLALPSVRATLSWDTLLTLQLRLASLEVDATELLVRRDAEGRLFVAGYAIRAPSSPDHRAAEWLLAQDHVRVRGATLVWRDESVDADRPGGGPRPDLVVTDVVVALDRSAWRHRVAVRATPPAALGAPLDLRALIEHRLFAKRLSDPADWRGEIYADVASGDVLAWKTWLPLPPTVDAGHGRARVWLTFSKADAPAGVFARGLAERLKRPLPAALDRIASVTADLALDDVALRWGAMADAPEYSAIASIDGRLAGSQTPSEQRFAAIRMALQPRDGAKVVPTDFEVRRTIGAAPDDEKGSATLGAIDIGASLALVPEPLVPPAIAERLAALRPRGALEQASLHWTGPAAAPATFEAEVRFARLAIAPQAPTPEAIAAAAREIVGANGLVRKPRRAFGVPGFENVAGTVTATRTAAPKTGGGVPVTQVALTLRGDDVVLTAPGLFDDPTLRFAHLAAHAGVRVEGPDLEVTVDHTALDNADIAGTVAMTFRHGPKSGGTGADGGRGWMDLDARFLRADVARIPRYLPNIIGERARIYLKRSLVAGTVDDATLRMRGPIEKLNLRDMPGALAVPNPVPVPAALVDVRDGTGRPAAPATAAIASGSDGVLFHAAIKVHGTTFRYGPAREPDDPPPANGLAPSATAFIGWPAFEDVDADIVFDQARLTVHARAARVYDYRLTDITAELPALADPNHVLRVVGRGTGPMQDLVHFINDSPISRWLRGFTASTKATGNATLALALDLPLTRPRGAEVAGSLRFAHNDLALNPIVPPLFGMDGRMDFSDRGLTIDGLTANALGGPLRIDAATHSDGYIELNANGTIDIAALQKSTHETSDGVAQPASNAVDRAGTFLSGHTGYQVALRVRSKRVTDLADNGGAPPTTAAPAAGQPDLVVRADLRGLAIDLPAPFSKPADAVWPLQLELARTVSTSATTPDTERIRITLADIASVDIARQRTPEGTLAVTHAGYRIGHGEAVADGTSRPSTLAIDLPSLDLDAWRAALRRGAQPNAADHPAVGGALDAFLPSRATLKTGSLRAAGRAFTNVSIIADRTGAGWQADVAADQVGGKISYTDVSGRTDAKSGVAAPASARLVARLTHLTIPESAPASAPESAPEAAPEAADHSARESTAAAGGAQVDDALEAGRQRDFPAIDVVVDRFELRGRTLGRLEVVARNVDTDAAHEWQLQKLGLTVPEARFVASGVWGRTADGDTTRLDFDLAASDVGALMDRFGLKRTINRGTAQLSGNAAWNGAPTKIDFASMSGSLKLAADKGQFLKAEPGVAKLLNILSLQGLARRLTLDFSDVFSPGFAFDTVRADAIVDHGIATTDDFTMRGVEALVTMAGKADLAHETTDLHVRVEPQINAGAASLGVAVINPAVGLATFAAQYLFKDSISRALSFEYNVSGPWARPDVVRIDRTGHATPVVPKDAGPARNE